MQSGRSAFVGPRNLKKPGGSSGGSLNGREQIRRKPWNYSGLDKPPLDGVANQTCHLMNIELMHDICPV